MTVPMKRPRARAECLTPNRAWHISLMLLGLLLRPVTALAQDVAAQSADNKSKATVCGRDTAGQTMCKQGMLFECRNIAPGTLDRVSGWQWKSDILRSCGEMVPATIQNEPSDLLQGFSYSPQITSNSSGLGYHASPGRPMFTPSGQPGAARVSGAPLPLQFQ